MSLTPWAEQRIDELIAMCLPGISVCDWWSIGNHMHTVNGDYDRDDEAAQVRLRAMWEAWRSVDPRPKDHGITFMDCGCGGSS